MSTVIEKLKNKNKYKKKERESTCSHSLVLFPSLNIFPKDTETAGR